MNDPYEDEYEDYPDEEVFIEPAPAECPICGFPVSQDARVCSNCHANICLNCE